MCIRNYHVFVWLRRSVEVTSFTLSYSLCFVHTYNLVATMQTRRLNICVCVGYILLSIIVDVLLW